MIAGLACLTSAGPAGRLEPQVGGNEMLEVKFLLLWETSIFPPKAFTSLNEAHPLLPR